MRDFVKYFIVWVSQNLSIPFWVIGHIHLSLNVYQDLHEVITSLTMNIIVGVGFYLSWIDHKNDK